MAPPPLPLCHVRAAVSHTYGPLNGTSMATPIVSASAALTLSLLGASDGNYYKAAQVRRQGHRLTGRESQAESQAGSQAGCWAWKRKVQI
jgi:subtilisin family serine protease